MVPEGTGGNKRDVKGLDDRWLTSVGWFGQKGQLSSIVTNGYNDSQMEQGGIVDHERGDQRIIILELIASPEH